MVAAVARGQGREEVRYVRACGVERIEWCAVTGNTRSRRLAEKLGFKHEGTRRSDYVLRGERLSTDILSLVGEEIDQAVARG